MEESKLRGIKEKVTKPNSLFINRIPEKTRLEFIKLAKEEFDSDYGFLVKHLMDIRDGLIMSPNTILLEQIEVLAQEIESLKQSKVEDDKKPKGKVIRSVSGRVITRKED